MDCGICIIKQTHSSQFVCIQIVYTWSWFYCWCFLWRRMSSCFSLLINKFSQSCELRAQENLWKFLKSFGKDKSLLQSEIDQHYCQVLQIEWSCVAILKVSQLKPNMESKHLRGLGGHLLCDVGCEHFERVISVPRDYLSLFRSHIPLSWLVSVHIL